MTGQDLNNLKKLLSKAKKSYSDFNASMNKIDERINTGQYALGSALDSAENKISATEDAVINGLESTLVDK